MIPLIFDLVGVALLVTGAALLAPWAGFLVAGVGCLAIAKRLETR